ncbi:unnamed protein product [Cuscuta europaea]|uniref:Uncharacterized protein n=1 Tax=Cuscuta europaea TaxID=41803 RepID=A0A9P1EDM1_CUSEU|nr:unnamed protein product [Cuscuta europaea]
MLSTEIKFDIVYLCGNGLDGYLHYLQGSTPESLRALVLRVANGWAPYVYVGFRNLCIIAATTQRNKVTEYLNRPANAALSAEITKHFYVRDHVNFSALNLIGHMIIAASGKTEHRGINRFRKRCGGESIWHADLDRSKFSEAQENLQGKGW